MPAEEERAVAACERALDRALDRHEIVKAATDAGATRDELERDLRAHSGAVWTAVEDESAALERLERELAGQEQAIKGVMGRMPRVEAGLWAIGLTGALGGLFVFLYVTGSFLLRVLVGHPRWKLSAVASAAIGGAFVVGVGALWIAFTLYDRRARPAAEAGLLAERDSLREQVSAAVDVLETALLQQGMLPVLRDLIDRRTRDSFFHELAFESTTGLAEPFDPRFEIATRARAEVERIVATRAGANIGLAGPRGVGKTTLIASVARAVDNDCICVRTAAPVEYEAREFLLHLFGLLCEAVLDREGVKRVRRPIAAPAPEREAWQAVRRAAATAGRLLDPPGTRAEPANEFPRAVLARRAAELLDEIRFQQAYTRGWSGGLRAPVATAQVEGGSTYTREAMTLPDVVAGFRELAAQLGTRTKVIVGIDELDKMDSERSAERFLNDVKAIFDVRNCFYLVSVSEDALSRFERRGVPLRDAFDSALDEIVRVPPLDLADAAALVRRRVIGVPVPYLALAHSLSGGIPRDLLRVVRRIATHADEVAPRALKLTGLTHDLLRDDLLRKVAATTLAPHDEQGAERAAALFAWASALRASSSADALQIVCEAIATDAGLEEELRAYAYFVSTLLAFFDERLDEARMRAAMEADDAAGVERLAEARHALAFSARAAWGMLSAFRERWELPLLDAPSSPASAPV